MDLSYQDSSDEDSNMIIVRDDDPTEAGPTSGPLVAGSSMHGTSVQQRPSRVMEIEYENVVDENENAISVSDGESEAEADLIMPIRKSKDPSPVWTCADRVEGGGAKCRFCPTIIKCTKGSTSTIVNHLIKKHRNKAAVKDLEEAIEKKRGAVKLKRLQDQKKKIMNAQPSILNFSTRRGIIDSFKKKKLDEAIVKMIVLMNKPFSDVENPFFRQVLFTAEPNYLCPSRHKVTALFDDMAKKIKEDLKLEITKDIEEAGHFTLNICSDHGTSSDRHMTKKNAVTVARTTKDFVIKKDTLKLITCEGSQTGLQIRKDIKQALIFGAGWKEGVKINWVTDNESKQINARDPSKHQAVGLPTFHTGSCVDHTLELAAEESIKQCPSMKESITKVRNLINYVKDSSTAREELRKIMENTGFEALAIVQGTSNRWFFKYTEVRRALILKDPINEFFQECDVPTKVEMIEDDDWKMLLIYENSMKSVVEAARVLEGELYPTASSVIPFLDTVFEDLKLLSRSLNGEGKVFVDTLLSNLSRRFQAGYKQTKPYNCLTLLDIRHTDLYFSTEDYEKAVQDLSEDALFNDELHDPADGQAGSAQVQDVPLQGVDRLDNFSRRRAQLLAAKQVTQPIQQLGMPQSIKQRLEAELSRFLNQGSGTVEPNENPNAWWRVHHTEFPLLSKYWIALCAFPATSTSAERVFNMDGLVLTPCRKSLDPERTGDLIICRDYWLSRAEGVDERFKLCSQCPKPPSPEACYKISCAKHNKVL